MRRGKKVSESFANGPEPRSIHISRSLGVRYRRQLLAESLVEVRAKTLVIGTRETCPDGTGGDYANTWRHATGINAGGKANAARSSQLDLVVDLEAELFDDGIREDFLGNAFHLRLRFFAGESIESEDEKFPLADALDFRVAQGRECAVNRLALRIENGSLQHDPNVSFHLRNYTSPPDFAAA